MNTNDSIRLVRKKIYNFLFKTQGAYYISATCIKLDFLRLFLANSIEDINSVSIAQSVKQLIQETLW